MTGLELTSGFGDPNEDGDIHDNDTSNSCLEWGVSRLVTGSSACVLWSAIALGALIKGAPSEEVSLLDISSMGSSPHLRTTRKIRIGFQLVHEHIFVVVNGIVHFIIL